MSNSYRIRTEVGKDKAVSVYLDQDFEYLEILSLKLLQSQIYTRPCSDYGVVIGRVSVNNGFGIPNAKVSVFIPLTNQDELNPIVSDLYPYRSVSDLNEDGYRYNLLPYTQQHGGHTPTGTFFEREDVLVDPTLIEVFDKYYKYTARTNDSGDYMIFGVPLGSQLVHIDIDLSDIGEFSLFPQDLIRMGRATESQVAGINFRNSTNLGELPQIVSINKNIVVEPLWGQEDLCNIGITRCDFDLTDGQNIRIEPTAIFMGSIFSDTERMALKRNCKPRFKQGELCNLVAGPGEILAIRQTIFPDINGRPALEVYPLESGGQVIDDNGTWVVDVPMNLDYVVTNEFGQQVISNDPSKGIPTKGKYRFKVKWNQSPNLTDDVKRGYFLVPNVREYGWNANGTAISNLVLKDKSYAFSIDWNDYADIPTAIKCDDTFYEMKYNKVYTVSQLIDQFRRGSLPNRFVSIKNILDDNCESENNRFPTNDVVFRTDIIYILYLFAAIIFRPVIYALIFLLHVVYLILTILKFLMPLLLYYFSNLFISYISFALGALAIVPVPAVGLAIQFFLTALIYLVVIAALIVLWVKLLQGRLKPINLPIMLYDSCEFCKCKDDPDDIKDTEFEQETGSAMASAGLTGFQPSLNDSGIIIAQLSNGAYNQSLVASNPEYNAINLLLTGQGLQNGPGSTPTCGTFVPGLEVGVNSSGDKFYYTTNSLTVAERLNLFNTKAKYFNSSGSNNPGGGVNRIRVSFDNGNQYHYDNVVFLLLTPESAPNIATGDIITFQDPNLSQDINVTGATFNQYLNNSITGTPVTTTSYNRTIQYANFNGIGNTSIVYNLPAPNSADTAYHKFPTDIEYFQVITAMTYSDFDSVQGNTLPNSLNQRYIKNFSYILAINEGGTNKNDATSFNRQPFVEFTNYQSHVCVMLVRGVDPYSTRQNVEYQLGRIFGHSSENAVIINGSYKLNEPIKAGFKNVAHNIGSNTATDAYSNLNLYYDTFSYQPDITQFSGFNSNLPSYYSILDNNFNAATFGCSCPPLNVGSGSLSNTTYGRIVANAGINNGGCASSISNGNGFAAEFNFGPTTGVIIGCGASTFDASQNSVTTQNKGYFNNEVVEGGSLMIIRTTLSRTSGISPNDPTVDSAYVSFKYPTTTQLTYSLGPSNRKLVMRSDRLPASTQNISNCNISYLLQNNMSLGIYKLTDNGTLPSPVNSNFNPTSVGPGDPIPLSSQSFGNDVINSLNSCNDSVPLACYDYANNEFFIKDRASCFYSKPKEGEKLIFENGCYIFITKIIKSIPADLRLLTEWLARMNVTFAACRNVFSHLFTNNWINGTLYAFAFKNSRIFNGQNQPTGNKICTDVVHFDTTTNNFYYRSSPYHSGATGTYFCAEQSNDAIQKANLKYPTTLMDLGPKTAYIQELVMSDDFDGYVVKDLKSTTFNDVSDLLNIFILSRLANSSFNQLLVSGGGGNIFNYFNERGKKLVDGDYPQMISINSELGVAEFEGENYPPVAGGQDPIYFSDGTTADGVFGVFFSSETQVRDFITPKRTIVSPNVPPTNICAYSYFSVFSQEVPLYQWEIKPNQQDDNIFGSQLNTWYTEDLAGGVYHSSRYQNLDRINPASRYFRTVDGYTNQSLFLGHIYGWYINPPAPATSGYTAVVNSQDFNAIYPRVVTVGAPFHFYFGLKKGKSAWDRFAQKWIGFEIV